MSACWTSIRPGWDPENSEKGIKKKEGGRRKKEEKEFDRKKKKRQVRQEEEEVEFCKKTCRERRIHQIEAPTLRPRIVSTLTESNPARILPGAQRST